MLGRRSIVVTAPPGQLLLKRMAHVNHMARDRSQPLELPGSSSTGEQPANQRCQRRSHRRTAATARLPSIHRANPIAPCR